MHIKNFQTHSCRVLSLNWGYDVQVRWRILQIISTSSKVAEKLYSVRSVIFLPTLFFSESNRTSIGVQKFLKRTSKQNSSLKDSNDLYHSWLWYYRFVNVQWPQSAHDFISKFQLLRIKEVFMKLSVYHWKPWRLAILCLVIVMVPIRIPFLPWCPK